MPPTNEASPTVLISMESLDERINWRWSERDLDADVAEEQAEWSRAPDVHDEKQTPVPNRPAYEHQMPSLVQALGFDPLSATDGTASGFDPVPSQADPFLAAQAEHWQPFDAPTVSPSSLHAPPGLSSLGLTWAGDVPGDYRPAFAPLPRLLPPGPGYGPLSGDEHQPFGPPHVFGLPAFHPAYGRTSAYYPPPSGQAFQGADDQPWRPFGGEAFGTPHPSPQQPMHGSAPCFQPSFLPTPHSTFDVLPPPPVFYGEPMGCGPHPPLPSPTSPFMPFPGPDHRSTWSAPAHHHHQHVPARPRPPPSPLDLRASQHLLTSSTAHLPVSQFWPPPVQHPPAVTQPGEDFYLQPSFGRSIYTLAADAWPSGGPAASPPAPSPSPFEHSERDAHVERSSAECLPGPHLGPTPPPFGHPPAYGPQKAASTSAGLAPIPLDSRQSRSQHPSSPDKVALPASSVEWRTESSSAAGPQQPPVSRAAGTLPVSQNIPSLPGRSEALSPPVLRSSIGSDRALDSSRPVEERSTSSTVGKKRLEPSGRTPAPPAKKRKTATSSPGKSRRRRSQCKNACSRCQRLHKVCDGDGRRPCGKCVKNLGAERAQLECHDSPRVESSRRRSLQEQAVSTSDEVKDDDESSFGLSSDLSSPGSSSLTSRASTPAHLSTPLHAVAGRPLRSRVESPAHHASAGPAPTHAYKTRANKGLPV